MERGGYRHVTPTLRDEMNEAPLLDFDAGYVLRARGIMPKSGDREPWKNSDRYTEDLVNLKLKPSKYSELEFH
jgi:hypothetical protein